MAPRRLCVALAATASAARQKRAAQEPIAAEGRLVVVMAVCYCRLRCTSTTLHVNCHFSSPLGLRSLVLPVDVVDEIKRLLFDVKLDRLCKVLEHELARLDNMLWLRIVVALLQDTKGISKYVRGHPLNFYALALLLNATVKSHRHTSK